jgi:hypothetical protein
MRVLSINQIRISLKHKASYDNFPKLPNAVLGQCTTVNDNNHRVVVKDYSGNHSSVGSFLKRVGNWESNELSNAMNKLDRK